MAFCQNASTNGQSQAKDSRTIIVQLNQPGGPSSAIDIEPMGWMRRRPNNLRMLLTLGRRRDKVFLGASGSHVPRVHLHHQAGKTRGLEVLEWGVVKGRGCTHPEFLVVLVQCIKERLGTTLHEPSPFCLDALSGGGADVQTEEEL